MSTEQVVTNRSSSSQHGEATVKRGLTARKLTGPTLGKTFQSMAGIAAPLLDQNPKKSDFLRI
jgi:hypothetical protein